MACGWRFLVRTHVGGRLIACPVLNGDLDLLKVGLGALTGWPRVGLAEA